MQGYFRADKLHHAKTHALHCVSSSIHNIAKLVIHTPTFYQASESLFSLKITMYNTASPQQQ